MVSPDRILEGVLEGVADDVGSPAGPVNGHAGDSFFQMVTHYPDCIFAALQQQSHKWNVQSLLQKHILQFNNESSKCWVKRNAFSDKKFQIGVILTFTRHTSCARLYHPTLMRFELGGIKRKMNV